MFHHVPVFTCISTYDFAMTLYVRKLPKASILSMENLLFTSQTTHMGHQRQKKPGALSPDC